MMKWMHGRERIGGHRLPGFLLTLAGIQSGLSACYVGVREPVHEVDGAFVGAEVYAPEPAPPPQAEVVVGVAPSSEHVWVGGYWTRHKDSWFWVRGRWAARPRPGAVWVDGRWDHHPRGYAWVGGHWR
jgi:hypothetical protein